MSYVFQRMKGMAEGDITSPFWDFWQTVAMLCKAKCDVEERFRAGWENTQEAFRRVDEYR